MADEKREKLLDFLDKKAFDPVLQASPDRFEGRERDMYKDVRRSTESEKKRFHDDYRTARDVRDNYMSDLTSETGKRKTHELEQLRLPALSHFRQEFQQLCNDLGV